MAKKNSWDGISQADYAINQYFARYIAPVIDREYGKFNQRQQQSAIVGMYYDHTRKPGNLDAFVNDLVDRTIGEKASGTLLNDLALLAYNWMSAAYKKLGKTKFLEMDAKAQAAGYINCGQMYMVQRIEDLIIKQMARQHMSSSSIGYIIEDGVLRQSILGALQAVAYRNSAVYGKLSELSHEYVKAGTSVRKATRAEKAGAWATGIATDAVAFGGYSSGAAAAKGLAASVGLDAAAKVAFSNEGKTKKASAGDVEAARRYMIYSVYGSDETAEAVRSESKKWRNNATSELLTLNAHLKQKIKVSPNRNTSITLSASRVLSYKDNYDSRKLFWRIKVMLTRQTIPFDGTAAPPQWMRAKTESQCRAQAAWWYSLAMYLSGHKKEGSMVCGRYMTLKEIGQRAYDYAHVANEKRQAFTSARDAVNREAKLQRQEAQRAASLQASPQVGDIRQQGSEKTVAVTPSAPFPQTGAQQTAQIQEGSQYALSGSGWENLMKNMGMSGLAGLGENLGYVAAMLPSLVVGIFSGTNKSFTLKQNMMPLAIIFGSLFFGRKHPMMRLMGLLLGGGMLLDNASKEALDVGRGRMSVSRGFRKYENESLDRRLGKPVLKGCTMVLDIDGTPCCVRISDDAVLAYEQGALPLNTLANAVLRKYDEQVAGGYKESAPQEKERQQQNVIR